jgi:hypothetical protein
MTDGLGDPILGVEPHALATIHKLAPRAAPLSLLIGYGVFTRIPRMVPCFAVQWV